MNRRWLVNKTNRDFLEFLSRKASISTALVQILVNRGIKDLDAIKDFLSPSLEDLYDPFLMPDMDKAFERIRTAVQNDETVFVHGDYDADGITSTAVLVSALRALGLKTDYYIPHRTIDGYGLSRTGIKKAESSGAGLILTVDCGISSLEEVSMAGSLGMDVIITDHHEPPKKLPDALAIVNPHRTDSKYPFKSLAGVGVAYKLVQALFQSLPAGRQAHSQKPVGASTQRAGPEKSGFPLHYNRQNTDMEELLAIVAIGTIADSVPLTGENRILVTYGLKALNNSSFDKPWVSALREISGSVDKQFRADTLSFTIIPRINAAGRLDDANEVVELFLTPDSAKAKAIASFLEDQNRKRQKIERDVYRSALAMIDGDHPGSAIVLHSDDWHPGVIGIAASRIADMFYRPTFLFSVKDGVAKGSARSIPPFHLYKGIMECEDLLTAFGGHSQAAGLRLSSEDLPVFRDKMNAVVESSLSSEDLIPTIEIDVGVELFEVNFNLVNELDLLEPCGNSNRLPVLGVKGVEMVDPRIVGSNHLKMRIKQKSVSMDSIGFSMGGELETIETLSSIDIAFVPGINKWNGNRFLQLNLKALRPNT